MHMTGKPRMRTSHLLVNCLHMTGNPRMRTFRTILLDPLVVLRMVTIRTILHFPLMVLRLISLSVQRSRTQS